MNVNKGWFRQLKIKQKMILYVLGITALIYSITFSYIGISLKDKPLKEARNLADSYALQKTNDISSRMQEDLSVARSMTVILSDYADLPPDTGYSMQKPLMISTLKKYPDYDAFWMSWELGAIDPWTLPYGRKRITYFWKDGQVTEAIEIIDTDGRDFTGDYYRLRKESYEEMSEPYVSEDYEDGYIKLSYSNDLGQSSREMKLAADELTVNTSEIASQTNDSINNGIIVTQENMHEMESG